MKFSLPFRKPTFALVALLSAAGMIPPLAAQSVLDLEDGAPVSIATVRKIESEALGEERTLLVSLPNDYADTESSYPVLYVLYGDQVRGYFAEAVHVVDRLSSAGVIPRLIVVGIANVERYRDLSPTGRRGNPSGIESFVGFVCDEMIPFVDSEYRTKDYRILIGPQAGAEFGMHVLTEGLGLFNAYILNNPFEGAYREELGRKARELRSEDLPSHTFLQITCIDRHMHGSLSEAVDAARRFEATIAGRSLENLELHVHVVENNEDFIPSPRPKLALKRLFADYSFPADRQLERLEDFTSYYDALAARLGVDVGFPEMTLYIRADGLVRAGKTDAGMEMLDYLLEKNPRSLSACWALANAHRGLGNREIAIELYERCLEIMPNMAPARECLEELRGGG